MVSRCTSRPDCPCAFCVSVRTEEQPGEELSRLAEDFVRQYEEQQRDREEDRAAHARGWLPHKVLFCEWPELYLAVNT